VPAADTESYLTRYREDLLGALRAAIGESPLPHYAMMRYHMGWETAGGAASDGMAGKMLRPALCLLACEAVRGAVARALPAAVAVELLHNFSLIHDDIEDQSDERHGRPTVWKLWGIPQAVNVGDGMFALAQRAMEGLSGGSLEAADVLHACRTFSAATLKLCEGQHLDMSFERRTDVTLADYFQMVSGKTGALMGAASAIGALAGGADARTVAALQSFGESAGIAFQVFDDYLGIWGDPARTGKPVYDDIRSRKKSYPVLLAMEQSGPAVRAELLTMYAKERFNEDEIERVLHVLNENGTADATLAEARRIAEGARAAIAPLDLLAGRKRELLDFLDLLVDRAL
jgi:geranylgeranyl diphosphate synthase type I